VSPFLMAYVIAQWVSTLRCEHYEFHKPVLFGLTAPNPRGTKNHLRESLLTAVSLQVTRGSQLNLEIAQAVSQRRLSLSTGFQAGRKCVEASDDVIENDLTTSVDNRK